MSFHAAPDRTLVTGFLAFGRFDTNPSALLAQSCDRRHQLIEVAFEAVDEFLDHLNPLSFDRLLMLGVCGTSDRFRLECVARNIIGADPDVRLQIRGPGPIDPSAPPTLNTTLWASARVPAELIHHDAGCYLCNYAYFRALTRFPQKQVGFCHVPPMEVMAIDNQRDLLRQLIDQIESRHPR
jgi:pyrrolidone-carboxylate peptidase